MNLTKSEIRILRRDLPAVASLFQKGLLTVRGEIAECCKHSFRSTTCGNCGAPDQYQDAGAHVELTDAGRAWLQADKERITQAKVDAGRAGGIARDEALTRKQKVRIARMGGRPPGDPKLPPRKGKGKP